MKRRLVSRESKTAQWTCFVRAISFQETKPHYKCDDWLASRMLTGILKVMSPQFLNRFARLFMPVGSYEHVIARTKYFDEALKKYSADARQILIFGAGFDSRPVRLSSYLSKAAVFEVDTPFTQRTKSALLSKSKVKLPSNLVFIPVDFETESLADKLNEGGVRKNLNTIFMLEGLTMYLSQESVDNIFKVISDFAGRGSIVIFDFIDLEKLDKISRKRKGQLFYVTVSGERYVFAIDQHEINQFLFKYSFEPIDISDSRKLEARFFTDEKGNQVGSILGRHTTIVVAKKI